LQPTNASHKDAPGGDHAEPAAIPLCEDYNWQLTPFLTILIQLSTIPLTTKERTTLITRGGGNGPTKPRQPPGHTGQAGANSDSERWQMRRGDTGASSAVHSALGH
jgi:hypothetical protein